MAQDFTKCLGNVLQKEGGYSNNPHDPGGATNLGITQRVLTAWRGNGHPEAPVGVRGLTPAVAGEIYLAQYWTPVRCGELPSGVDNCVFDESVNSGPVRAAIDLQMALRKLGQNIAVDGHVGEITIAAAKAVGPSALIGAICDYRLSFLGRLAGWRWFQRGWANRVAQVRRQSLAMVK